MSSWTTRPDPGQPPPPLAVPVATAAGMIGLSVRETWRRISTGELPTVKVGRRRIVRIADLERWLAARMTGSDA